MALSFREEAVLYHRINRYHKSVLSILKKEGEVASVGAVRYETRCDWKEISSMVALLMSLLILLPVALLLLRKPTSMLC